MLIKRDNTELNPGTEKEPRDMGSILNTIINIVLIFAMILSFVCTYTAFVTKQGSGVPSILGYIPLSIQSDSMSPFFKSGDLIIDTVPEDAGDLEEGDVITFWTVINGMRVLNTHRIIEVGDGGKYTYYITQGDNNSMADPLTVHESEVVGVYKTKIPGLGSGLDFLQTGKGFFLIVVLPVFAFFVYYLIEFFRALFAYQDAKNRERFLREQEALTGVKLNYPDEFLDEDPAPQSREPQNPAPQSQAPVYQAPQNQMPQSQTSNYQMPQGQAPGYQMPQGQAPGYQMPQGQMPGYQMPQGQAPGYPMPQGQMPGYQMPQGQAPGYPMPQGQMPGYQMPQGQMPGYQMPQGQMPGYQMPQGQVPGYQMPQGQMPQNQAAGITQDQLQQILAQALAEASKQNAQVAAAAAAAAVAAQNSATKNTQSTGTKSRDTE